ncbi:hypothetical protein HK102_000726 [Quaeritorhiza haematococci]|nr:hypothetical protein HK102_000726 [Quaeritorhiza haematococci]
MANKAVSTTLPNASTQSSPSAATKGKLTTSGRVVGGSRLPKPVTTATHCKTVVINQAITDPRTSENRRHQGPSRKHNDQNGTAIEPHRPEPCKRGYFKSCRSTGCQKVFGNGNRGKTNDSTNVHVLWEEAKAGAFGPETTMEVLGM